MQSRFWISLAVVCVAGMAFISGDAQAETINVEPGRDSLRAALARAGKDAGIREIVLADGLYEGVFRIQAPKNEDGSEVDNLPPLVIRAADGARPLFRYALKVTEAAPVKGHKGLYRFDRIPQSSPQMWERDTRVRYKTLSNIASVAAHPGSCFVDRTEGKLYFSTSDGQPPNKHEVWLSLARKNSRVFAVYRENTVIDGLHFADYININALAIQTYRNNITIRNCVFDNCETAWGGHPGNTGMVIENCVGRDVARGLYSHADRVVIRGCHFEKTRDRFLYEIYPQNDSAYQVYHPGRGATIVGNFAKGYLQAIFIKAQAAPYIIRHNTVVDAHMGIGFSHTEQDADVSYNIVVDAKSFIFLNEFRPNLKLDHNLFWQPRELSEFEKQIDGFRGANRGKFNLLADPRFVDSVNGDYRLLSDSPALLVKDSDGKPAGAFGVGTKEDAIEVPPTLSLAFEADSKPYGKNGTETFDRDPWIGGGTTVVGDLVPKGGAVRLVGKPEIRIRPRSFDSVGSIVAMRITIDDDKPQVVDFEDRHRLALPDRDGKYRVRYEVKNDRSLWSKPAEVSVVLDRQAPKIIGSPRIFANNHGIVVQIQTDEPCFAELSYGNSPTTLEGKAQVSPLVTRFWDANDGGEWVKTWYIPKTQQAIALLAPSVSTGQTVFGKLTLKDQAGLSTTTDIFNVVVQGKPRTLVASTVDGELSLQAALDIALPGDRVLLEPGVYTDFYSLSHGGVSDQTRITIEAQTPGTVTLDTAKQHNACIHLESAPYVTLRNLRLLYFKKAGVYSYKSPHTHIDACQFYNGPGWATGYHSFLFYSPNSTITNSIAMGAEIGFYFLKSPAATVKHNTTSQHMYAGASYTFSAENSVQMYNSFAFAGNDSFVVQMRHPSELKSFRSDYNNLGSYVAKINAFYEQRDPALWKQIKAEAFEQPKYEQYIRTSSKAIVSAGKRYVTMKGWQEASGQDKHSLFADPKYVAPWPPIDKWDLSVRPDSPNLTIRDEQGRPIGAVGEAQQ